MNAKSGESRGRGFGGGPWLSKNPIKVVTMRERSTQLKSTRQQETTAIIMIPPRRPCQRDTASSIANFPNSDCVQAKNEISVAIVCETRGDTASCEPFPQAISCVHEAPGPLHSAAWIASSKRNSSMVETGTAVSKLNARDGTALECRSRKRGGD
jgi:hypothetical protein